MAPVNPHAETYQGKTQFSGPIKAGTRWFPLPDYDRTTPTTVSPTALPNTGYVVCSQSAAVEEGAGSVNVTDIKIPAGSMILSIQVIVTTAYTAPANQDMLVGAYTDAPAYGVTTLGTWLALGYVGVFDYSSAISGTVGRWKDISTMYETPTDTTRSRSIDIVTHANSGSGVGRGILTISYIPGLHLLT